MKITVSPAPALCIPTGSFHLPHAQSGFTLVELAIVLFIVSLLLGGMLLPLSAQQDIRYQSDTQKQLADINEALLGYAASKLAADGKPYLPCPDTDGDGRENRVGNACTSPDGDLPWQDLGIGRQDAWNNAFRYRVTAAFSNNAVGFTLASTGDMRICDRADCSGTILATGVPAVVLSRGKNGASAAATADEQENLDGDIYFVQHSISSDGYDDQVVWLSANLLFNRMLSAGRLP
ncbi:MAG: general secretion pathway protein GspH [Betaproteobacteria bacterium HGW-Betaproteobacteria-11]|nr:MAG: general secretion pathway protein GspH [Betaproteobacteria bacterium HGW-Betaproteobacteria-11]